MKLVANTVLMLFLFVIAACQTDDENLPHCLDDEIRDFKKEVFCNNGATVSSYEFQDDLVYIFSDGLCISDGLSKVISSDCDSLGILGGIAGFSEINGVNFDSAAVFVEIVWEN